MAPDVWLLPGMDGTGRLFAPLVSVLARPPRVIAYPRGASLHDELLEHVGLPNAPTVLVAESFSGPLAVRLALRTDAVRALVLVASFVRGSRAPLVMGRALEAALALRPPRLALRLAMLGLDADDALVDLVRDAIASVPASTMMARVREAARTDVREEFRALRVPIVWLRARGDRLVPRRATRDAQAVRPDLDVREMGGPHLLAQTRPREVAAVIREVLG